MSYKTGTKVNVSFNCSVILVLTYY